MMRSRFSLLVLVGIGAGVLGLFTFLTWRFQLYVPVARGLRAISGAVYGVSSRVSGTIYHASGADYMRCVAERDSFARDTAELKSLRAENLALKSALDYQGGKDEKFVTARVVAAHYEGTSQFLTLDRGSSSGVVTGAAVVVMDGIFIGKIGEVWEHAASVILLADASSKTSVVLTDEGGEELPGVLEGERGITIGVSLIPQDKKIIPGSLVISAGLDASVPRGLLIGSVGRVEKEEGEAFQRALVDPPSSSRYPVYVSILVQ